MSLRHFVQGRTEMPAGISHDLRTHNQAENGAEGGLRATIVLPREYHA